MTSSQKNDKTSRWILFRLFVAIFILLSVPVSADEPERAKLNISGYGLLDNFELENLLKTFDDKHKEREYFDANYIEDAALILISRLNRDGYLQPKLTARVTLQDGSVKTYEWFEAIRDPLPRPIEARELEFQIEPGVLYYFDEIRFEGLRSIPEDDARAFFIERGALVKLKSARVFTPNRLERGLSSLTEVLARSGYSEASATAEHVEKNDASGAVRVTIRVNEGPRFLVRSIRKEIYQGSTSEPVEVSIVSTNLIYSQLWQQDLAQALRTTNFQSGFADTTVQITATNRVATNNFVLLDVVARVNRGERITLGDVRFSFADTQKTKRTMLKRRVRLDTGEILDRIKVETGRYRLARLGIFDSVGLRYEQVDDNTRNVIYELDEGTEVDVSMLFGFGTYELLRIGFEVNQYNVFGRAHRAKFRVSQSFRTSSADYLYTLPELVGEDVDVFFTRSV